MKNTFTQPNRPNIWQFVIWVYMPEVMPENEEQANSLLKQIGDILNLTIVKTVFNQFSPFGITAAAILSQSHLVLHTWPETEFMRIDLVTCSSLDKSAVENCIKGIMKPEIVLITQNY